jgi:lysophospholipase L1-like esterase
MMAVRETAVVFGDSLTERGYVDENGDPGWVAIASNHFARKVEHHRFDTF